MNLHDTYTSALRYASLKHKGQNVPGTEFPYIIHVTNVATEVLIAVYETGDLDATFAVTLALLHDVLEDTKVTYEEIHNLYGSKIADGVLALTKFSSLEKEHQIKDSLNRIKVLDKEVGAVKLADRIVNLDAPAADWKKEKRERYRNDAQLILQELSHTNSYLANRLAQKINEYESYVETGFK
ncbi:MAG: bifunctional (p)ppGpp synthetase/guanosine-3',5'-bis(diphosphate) 3'-pyrophosphohydrolase [Williamsia sp.]|nr:bifunctional (p)ppGpp synthetase/guanosine-3',5'-bis(diphosphate) 3'-pyrophosphohydrolase [Williamsia sp.]